MRKSFHALCFVLVITLALSEYGWAQRASERIKISYTATAMSLLPLFLGVDQKIYEGEGFQVDLVRISGGNIIPSALLNRELDYTSSANFSLFAGLPIRTIGAMQIKTPLSLVVRPEIKTGADLKGKAIAIARPGSLTDNIAREFARHYGLNPDRGDITTLGLGDHTGRIIALQTNRVQGAILDERHLQGIYHIKYHLSLILSSIFYLLYFVAHLFHYRSTTRRQRYISITREPVLSFFHCCD